MKVSNLILLFLLFTLAITQYFDLLTDGSIKSNFYNLYFCIIFAFTINYFTQNPIIAISISLFTLFDEEFKKFTTSKVSISPDNYSSNPLEQWRHLFTFLSILITPIISVEIIKSETSAKLCILFLLLFFFSMLSFLSEDQTVLPFGILVYTIYKKFIHISSQASDNTKILYGLSQILVFYLGCQLLALFIKYIGFHNDFFKQIFNCIFSLPIKLWTLITNQEFSIDQNATFHIKISQIQKLTRSLFYFTDPIDYVIGLILFLSRFYGAKAGDYEWEFYTIALLAFLVPMRTDKNVDIYTFKCYFWISYAIHCQSMNGLYFIISFAIMMLMIAYISFLQDRENLFEYIIEYYNLIYYNIMKALKIFF